MQRTGVALTDEERDGLRGVDWSLSDEQLLQRQSDRVGSWQKTGNS